MLTWWVIDQSNGPVSVMCVHALQVERACLVIRSAVASALAWEDIAALVKDAQMRRDPVAMVIHKLKLNEGLITLLLRQVIGLSM